MLLERRFVFYGGDKPRQMSFTYMGWDLVAGTP